MAEEHSQVGPVFHAESNPHIPWPDEAAIRRERNYQLLQAAASMVMSHDRFGISLTPEAAVGKAIALLTQIERQA